MNTPYIKIIVVAAINLDVYLCRQSQAKSNTRNDLCSAVTEYAVFSFWAKNTKYSLIWTNWQSICFVPFVVGSYHQLNWLKGEWLCLCWEYNTHVPYIRKLSICALHTNVMLVLVASGIFESFNFSEFNRFFCLRTNRSYWTLWVVNVIVHVFLYIVLHHDRRTIQPSIIRRITF